MSSLLNVSRYLEVADADALAAALPGLTAYLAATADQKAAALDQATLDVDSAMPYQGRRYDREQVRQFPRVYLEVAEGVPPLPWHVWDWSGSAGAAVVPDDVKRATLYQADSILAGVREPRLDAQHDGVVYELTGTDAESYKSTPGPGVPTGLCRRAWMFMRRYRLRSGSMA